jgi:hypothetical protein
VIKLKILEIYLAGKPKNTKGICILKDNDIILKTVNKDKEILTLTKTKNN